MHADEASLGVDGSRDAVRWYFGELVEEVARERPVSETRLVDGLARMASVADGVHDLPGVVMRYRGPDEVVLVLPPFRWRTITADANLAPPVAAACRAVHDRMAEALSVQSDTAIPIVLHTQSSEE